MSNIVNDKIIDARRDFLDDLVALIIEEGLDNPNESEVFMRLEDTEKEYVYEQWARWHAGEPPL